jgi:hypothetical protein
MYFEHSLLVNKNVLFERKYRVYGAVKWDREEAERDRHLFVCLFVSLLGGGVLTPYLFFLQIDTWEEKLS